MRHCMENAWHVAVPNKCALLFCALFIRPLSTPETANDSGEAARWPKKKRWAGIQKTRIAGQILTLGERLNNLKKAAVIA